MTVPSSSTAIVVENCSCSARMTLPPGPMSAPILSFLIVIFSFGVLAPVAQARAARFFVDHLQFGGPVPFDTIAQAAADHTTQGEGLAQAFDFDAF